MLPVLEEQCIALSGTLLLGGGRGGGGRVGTGRGLAELGLKISNPASASVDRKQLFDSLSASSINNNLKPTFSAPPTPHPLFSPF